MTDEPTDWAAKRDEIQSRTQRINARIQRLAEEAESKHPTNWVEINPSPLDGSALQIAFRPPDGAGDTLAYSVPNDLLDWAMDNRLVLKNAVTDTDREQMIVTFAPLEATRLAPQTLALEDLREFAAADCTTREMLYGWLSDGGIANQDIADALGRSKQTVSDGITGSESKRE
jgi:hypothetical protein